MVGEKSANQFFQKHTNSASKKCWGKNLPKEVKKTFFLFTRISLPKNGRGKNARNNFSRNTRIVRAKNVGEKIVGKKCEKLFLYSHEYRDQKMGGKKLAKLFFQKHTNSASKKCWGKNRRKEVGKRFFIFTRISLLKKGGKKRAKQLFQKHTNSASKKCWGKNRRKKVPKTFFIFSRIP